MPGFDGVVVDVEAGAVVDLGSGKTFGEKDSLPLMNM